ncbi:unnamed protein product [Durusdinium trenchii]|uniref:Integrase catalytic domain-containing protein n=1 Tax=Durusdinium trenchii TaxID=1381693 RepID=A0ABP0JL69_9DINO
MNSNKPISPNVRFLKNAQVPPNVKVPPNQFKTENAHGMKVGEAFDSFSADGLQPGELEGEDRTMTPFPRKEFAFVTEAMNELVEEGDMIFKAHGGITSLAQWDVMELCCDPTSLLIEEVIRQGGRAGRAGLHNQCDLTKPEGVERTLALLRQHRPRWIWVSFPCGPTSAVQALNERTPEGKVKSAYRKRHARKVLRGGLRVLQEHLSMDGEIAWEWPRFNKAWQLPEVVAFWEALQQCDRAHEVLGDGCMFGLTSPDGPVKKPWRFMTTRARALAGLARLCDGSHHHVPCLGQRARASAYYTKQLCHIAVKGMLEPSELIGGIVEVEPDPQVLEKLTPQELQHLMETVRKLHRLCGHPNNRALLKLLRARGASEELKAAALQLACPECQESRTATPATKVSLEREDTIWKTLQMDAFYFRHAKQVHHFLLLLDEASSFAVVREIKVHHEDESENISTPEVITALEESWCQIFGYPARIRCDAEGAFRGTALAMWCSERGIEMTHVPAEHHAATGAVEKAIGELRWKMETFLRNEPIEPRRAASAMVQAHNHVIRVGGFAPAQWAFGRSESVSVNPAEACSEGTPGHAMAESLRLRIEAEHLHNKLSADARISRAKNSRSKPARQFLPGNVVYYQRHKVPRRAPANEDVDMPRMRIARWYGPARVLACETRVDSSSTSRMPSSVIWLVSCGRLLKAHIDQIRHGSERELLIANSSGTMAMPWTFTMMSTSLHKGAFEDLTTSKAERFEAKRRQTFRPSHQDGKRLKTVREEEDPDDLASSSSEELLPDSEVHMDPTLKEGMHPDDSDELDIDRLLNDPSYMPLHPIEPPDAPMEESRDSAGKSFQHQRKRHEMEDRPHHAKFPKKYQDPDLIGWCSNMENDFILSVTIDAPANEDEWRQILKGPKKFTSKAVKKGVFALPVKELGDKMNCGPKDTVRLLRAAYGLVSAPREWYRDVDKIATTTCGMHRLVCEPCLWVCKDEHGKVQGAVASHVDDFIVAGNEDNALWHETLQKFHQALNWSPWEPDPYLHCGVEIHQQSNYSFHLDHSQYASQIKQIDLDKSTTEAEPKLDGKNVVFGRVIEGIDKLSKAIISDCGELESEALRTRKRKLDEESTCRILQPRGPSFRVAPPLKRRSRSNGLTSGLIEAAAPTEAPSLISQV